LEEGLIMAKGEWHPFRGPADFLIPDTPQELLQSVAVSTATALGGYAAYRQGVSHTMGRMAQHHYANPSLRAIRAAARAQTNRMGIWRGLGLAARLNPVVGTGMIALSVLYSIPPDPRIGGLTGYQRYQAEMASKWYMQPR
jgi:hypothetical protein